MAVLFVPIDIQVRGLSRIEAERKCQCRARTLRRGRALQHQVLQIPRQQRRYVRGYSNFVLAN